MIQNIQNTVHDKYAPYWAIGLVVLLITGLATIWFDLGSFWRGYVLDAVGPAWGYVLFRGLYTAKANNSWTRFFTPKRTLLLLMTACLAIELLQYLKVYDSTFDFWDLLAYVTVLIPVFLIDTKIVRQIKRVA